MVPLKIFVTDDKFDSKKQSLLLKLNESAMKLDK